MNNPKKNFAYNVVYQILIMIIPLITVPYLARVIGAEGVGTYSYTYSIVYYFMLLTLLGVNNYGNRLIAKVRDNKEKLSKNFWSVYLFQLITGIIMLILYVAYILLFDSKYKLYALIEILFVISAILDINWFFFGMEEFKKTITRNIFVKIASLVLIFILIKTPSDLWKYTLIMAGTTCLSQIILWTFLRKKVTFIKIKLSDIKEHIKPNLVLFIPIIAVNIYKTMDKIMIGAITNVIEVGYYDNAEKITNIPLTFITALGTVMLPRISNMIANGKVKQVENYIDKSMRFVMFMSLAMCFGLVAIGYNFSPLFFGKEFQKTGILIMMLSTTLPFLSFANVLRTQYLIPQEKDNIYIVSVTIGAVTNLIMNAIFIPIYASAGACIGTIVAEFSVMLSQAMAVKSELPIKKYISSSIPFLLKALLMFVIIYPINYYGSNSVFRILIQIALGAFIYGVLNIKYILSLFNIDMIRWRKR